MNSIAKTTQKSKPTHINNRVTTPDGQTDNLNNSKGTTPQILEHDATRVYRTYRTRYQNFPRRTCLPIPRAVSSTVFQRLYQSNVLLNVSANPKKSILSPSRISLSRGENSPNGNIAGIHPCANSSAKQGPGMLYWIASPRLRWF